MTYQAYSPQRSRQLSQNLFCVAVVIVALRVTNLIQNATLFALQ